jgi:hypothetical protein
MDVNHHSVVVRNVGGLPAHNVRFPHTVLPEFTVFPAIAYVRQPFQTGADQIVFPVLPPGAQVTISYLYLAPLRYEGVNLPIQSDEGAPKVLNVLLQPQLTRWQQRLVWTLLVIGVATVVYLGVQVVQWIASIQTSH